MLKLQNLLSLFRVDQWPKNLLIFSPIFLSEPYFQSDSLIDLLPLFALFIVLSSIVYTLNDLFDYTKDKINPFKKKRPLVLGTINKSEAVKALIILVLFFFTLGLFVINKITLIVLIFYFFLNLVYNLILKKIFLIDIIIVSFGYVLRVFSSYVELNFEVNIILLAGIFLLSLIILLIKRKVEYNSLTFQKTLSIYSNEKVFFKIFYFVNLLTIVIYYFFIKELLEIKSTIISFLPVIISLYRILSYLKNNRIYHNISNTLLTDPVILISFFVWFSIIIINISFKY